MDSLHIRPARGHEFGAVAGLRWRWVMENGATPAVTQDEFVRDFQDWARAHAPSHRCLVLARGETVIGMAWLAITARVPTPRSLERRSGDVQCVYVVPEERSAGAGGRLIDAVLELARTLGLERVTVHSSVRAISAYARQGFAVSPQLLQADLRS
ncbi:MAG TPA: GNAT family N-acetyltransferase [Amycolatopsis sp.]